MIAVAHPDAWLELPEGRPFFDALFDYGEVGAWDPIDMLRLMAGESSLIPTARNASGAEGLTQLMPSTRRNLGWDVVAMGQFWKAPPLVQLQYTASYFAEWRKRFSIPEWTSAGHLWRCNLMPATLRDESLPVFDKAKWKAGYEANRWLDCDGNGVVTTGELDTCLARAVRAVQSRFDRAIASLETVRALRLAVTAADAARALR